jgi:hypothetical protein
MQLQVPMYMTKVDGLDMSKRCVRPHTVRHRSACGLGMACTVCNVSMPLTTCCQYFKQSHTVSVDGRECKRYSGRTQFLRASSAKCVQDLLHVALIGGTAVQCLGSKKRI